MRRNGRAADNRGLSEKERHVDGFADTFRAASADRPVVGRFCRASAQRADAGGGGPGAGFSEKQQQGPDDA
jgi:hypothetical protein